MTGIRIAFLYPELMNIYGDRGNVMALVQRCAWRGLTATVTEVSSGAELDPAAHDLYFFGGGQDREQLTVADDLLRLKAASLRQAVENGAALLAICGGYQLLAKYYQPFAGPRLDGAGIFNAYTVAGKTRRIGNIFIRLTPEMAAAAGGRTTVVGFENHSGETFLEGGCIPLGMAEYGYGNNTDDTEGAVYRHAIGCYLHGALLPKNPHLADLLIRWALQHRYGGAAPAALAPLDDTLEWRAHEAAVRRTTATT